MIANSVRRPESYGITLYEYFLGCFLCRSRHEGPRAAREAAESLSSGQKPQPDLTFIPELMRPIPPVMPLSSREVRAFLSAAESGCR